ncbi:MAG: FAD binding domain-containing protein [Polyangiaceae bacterium]
MLPLPPFALHRPRSLDEAVSLLERLGSGAMLIAGGTDVLPGMKLGLASPRDLIALGGIPRLTGVRCDADTLRIGATTTLDVLGNDPRVLELAPALGEAARAVGGPHHRRMGTLGGNLCLDTRCRYYDQSAFWRQALGYCLKKDGTVCHVVPGGQRCVAAASNDTATAAIALEGAVVLAGPGGERTVALRDFYTTDGIANTMRRPDEVLVELSIPIRAGRQSAYEKLRRRASIDFPLLSVAARADVRDDEISALDVVVSALAARPRVVLGASPLAVGLSPSSVDIDAIARAAWKECRPVANLDDDVEWRRDMVPVLVRRALTRLGLGRRKGP